MKIISEKGSELRARPRDFNKTITKPQVKIKNERSAANQQSLDEIGIKTPKPQNPFVNFLKQNPLSQLRFFP